LALVVVVKQLLGREPTVLILLLLVAHLLPFNLQALCQPAVVAVQGEGLPQELAALEVAVLTIRKIRARQEILLLLRHHKVTLAEMAPPVLGLLLLVVAVVQERLVETTQMQDKMAV
jgi:hypothetical protein